MNLILITWILTIGLLTKHFLTGSPQLRQKINQTWDNNFKLVLLDEK